MLRLMWLFVLLIGTSSAWAQKDKPIPAPKPIVECENALDVTYLPQRLTGTFEDRWLKMNIHWHKNGPPRACLIFVHGGGYSGGDKDRGGGLDRATMEFAVKAGYAVANVNYILGDGPSPQIFPQVYWDFKAAIRFLRKHADSYNLDPTRFGAVGFSAGGWLISSSCYPEASDLVTRKRQIVPFNALAQRLPMFEKEQTLLLPMDDPQPMYGEYSARLQAVSFDFFQMFERMTPTSPATQVWIGVGGKSKIEPFCKSVGIPYSPAELTDPRFKGQNILHVPPMKSKTLSRDGKTEIELSQRVLEFFEDYLGSKRRTPSVEIRRGPKDLVSLVAIGTKTRVHFTLDKSEPTQKSAAYTRPIAVEKGMTLRAVAMAPNLAPSCVFTHDHTRFDPPTFSVPKAPKGKVGRPYRLVCDLSENSAKSGRPVVWAVSGHLAPPTKEKAKVADIGLTLDAKSGVLSGTPRRAGTFTAQIQCAWGYGQIASAQTVVMVIEE